MSTPTDDSHHVRITSQGKIKNWVSFALKSFQDNPELPLTFHTVPPTPSASTSPSTPHPKDRNNAQKQKLAASTALVPRLVSVVEIVKREYLKSLKERRASRMEGLYQYNQVGVLEEELAAEAEADGKEEVGEDHASRAAKIIDALSGTNHVRQTQTPFMRITLSTTELPHPLAAGATYQPPETRRLSKSAKARAARRRKREGREGREGGGEGGDEEGKEPEDVPMEDS